MNKDSEFKVSKRGKKKRKKTYVVTSVDNIDRCSHSGQLKAAPIIIVL